MKAYITNSLKWHIILWFSFLYLVIIILFGTITYKISSNILTNEIYTYSSKIVDEARNSLDSYFMQIESLMQITAGNSTLLNALKNQKDLGYGERLNFDRIIGDSLQNTLKINQNIKDIIIIDHEGYVYDFTGRGINQDYNFYSQDWFPIVNNSPFKSNYIGIHPQDYYSNSSDTEEEVISAVIPVSDYMNPNHDFYATIMFNLKAGNIQEVTKEITLEKSGFFLLVDNNNRLIYRPQNFKEDQINLEILLNEVKDKNESFTYSYNHQKILTVYKASKATNWKFIALIPQKEVLDHFSNIKGFTFLITLTSILLVIIISVLISSKITKPISRLIKRMGKIEQGNFDIKLYDNSTTEIEALSSRMDLMVERINYLNKDIYDYQIKNRDAVIKALQAQINPHFLYNTLQGIKSMAVCGKNNDISIMVTLLGNMLRYAVYNPKELVPIEQELAHVQDYLEIQRYRYPEQFEYIIKSDKSLEDFRTLKLILQPVVENSITHGLCDKANGLVTINVTGKEDGIEFCISDNGKGLSKSELDLIVNKINTRSKIDESSSIGLKNVHDRLLLRFGAPYGISISSEENKGVQVKVLIPKIVKGDGN